MATEIKPVLQAVDATMDSLKAMEGVSRGVQKTPDAVAPMEVVPAAVSEAERVQAEAALKKEVAAYQPGVAETATGISNMALGLGGMAAFMGPAALDYVGRGIGWVGNKTGVGFMERGGKAMGKPRAFMKNNTVGEVLERTNLDGVAKQSSKLFNGAGWVADKAANTGVGKWFTNRRANGQFGKANVALVKAQEAASPLAGIFAPAEALVGAGASGGTTAVAEAAIHADLLPHIEQIHTIVTKAPNIGHVNSEALHGAVTRAKEVAERIEKAGGKVASSEAIAGHTTKFLERAEITSGHLNGMSGWRKPGEAIKGMPGKLKTSNFGHTAVNTMFVAGSVASMGSDAFSARRDLRMAAELCADMEGKSVSEIGLAHLTFGNTPDVVRQAVNGTFKKNSLKFAADAGNIALNVVQALNHHFSMKKSMLAFAGTEVASRVADHIIDSGTPAAYVQFKQMYLAAKASGQQIPAEAYAEFIGTISHRLSNHGGGRSPFARAVAEQYAKAGTDPLTIMKELESGALTARISEVKKQAEARKHAAHHEAPVQHEASVSHRAVARGHRHRRDMPVVGEHTANIVNEPAAQPGVVRT